MKAWLQRTSRPTWEFRWDSTEYLLSHTTRRGTRYAIIPGPHVGRPFWIGRLYYDSWVNCEAELRAERIEFENGDTYWFARAR